MRILGILVWLGSCARACTVVAGDRILGADLARANAAFAVVPADFVVALSPMTGVRRAMDAGSLGVIARRFGVVADQIAPLCFERPARILIESDVRSAIEKVLGPAAKLDIIEFSRYPVPPGDPIFELPRLHAPPRATPDATVTWRGYIEDGGRAHAPIWVRLRVTRLEQWLEATSAIPAQQRIEPSHVVAKSGWRFPFLSAPPDELKEIDGKSATRPIQAGQALTAEMLSEPNAVERGDTVDAELTAGSVSLQFQGTAETAGRRGDTVVVWASGLKKRWRAQVQDKGKVRIDVDGKNSKLASVRSGVGAAGDSVDGRRKDGQAAAGTGIAARPVSD